MSALPYRHIMYLGGPDLMQAPALHQATQLAAASGCPLRLLALDRSWLIDVTRRLFRRAGEAARAGWQRQALAALETEAERARRHGGEVSAEVVWAPPRLGRWVEAAQARHADLLVKQSGGIAASVLFGEHGDAALATHSGVPLYVADDAAERPPRRLIVVFGYNPDPDAVRTARDAASLIGAARPFAAASGAELHVALLGHAPAEAGAARGALSPPERETLAAYAREGGIPVRHCHHRDGDPETALAALCQSLPGSALAIGVPDRSPQRAALLAAAARHAHGLLLVPLGDAH
ncbi:universal stress protein [Solimonas variicoloris]|uniref:universal stress protein n=1 Tax=Solimonas variicoloris TaxID=254408 RepID=UPI00146A0248|nr:universal stress protein [Solimonas variicoloris]